MQMDQPAKAIAAFEYGIRAAPQDELLYRVMLRLLEQKPASAAAANALGELEIRELEIR